MYNPVVLYISVPYCIHSVIFPVMMKSKDLNDSWNYQTLLKATSHKQGRPSHMQTFQAAWVLQIFLMTNCGIGNISKRWQSKVDLTPISVIWFSADWAWAFLFLADVRSVGPIFLVGVVVCLLWHGQPLQKPGEVLKLHSPAFVCDQHDMRSRYGLALPLLCREAHIYVVTMKFNCLLRFMWVFSHKPRLNYCIQVCLVGSSIHHGWEFSHIFTSPCRASGGRRCLAPALATCTSGGQWLELT